MLNTIQLNPNASTTRQRSQEDRHAEIAERKVIFLNTATKWVEDRRADERLSREQIGSLDSLGRLQAQRQSLLDNLAHIYARQPNADVSPGVLALVTIFSDNNEGCCTLSVTRMAQFLSRSPRRITDAIARLDKESAIVVERIPGGTSRIFPWVHKSFGSSKDALTWIVDLRAPSFPRKLGRPSLGNTPDGSVTPIFGTPDAGDAIPLTPASPNTTNYTTDEDDGPLSRFAITRNETLLEEFHELVRVWCSSTGSDVNLPPDRGTTDKWFSKELSAYEKSNAALLMAALAGTFNTIAAKSHDRPGSSTATAMLGYFRKTLLSEVRRLELDSAKLQKGGSSATTAASRPVTCVASQAYCDRASAESHARAAAEGYVTFNLGRTIE